MLRSKRNPPQVLTQPGTPMHPLQYWASHTVVQLGAVGGACTQFESMVVLPTKQSCMHYSEVPGLRRHVFIAVS